MSKEKNTNKGKRGAGTEQVLNTIAYGTVLEGSIITEGDIRIEGTVKGRITCNSKLVIGEKGIVEGNVDARNAHISGKVKGEVVIRELLQLQRTGNIEGDLFTEKLAVEVGAEFTGNCTMGAAAKSVLDKTPEKAADALRKMVNGSANGSVNGRATTTTATKAKAVVS